jgi:DNA modification methylase
MAKGMLLVVCRWTDGSCDMVNTYKVYNEDCITWMHEAAKENKQFDLSVFSPPFSSLYTYSNLSADMGNSRESDDEFILHFKFFTDALFPIIKEGRNVCVHVQNPARSMANHGYIGIWDMRGEIIRLFQSSGFNYYGEATIGKNPQAQSIRTKTQCLTFSQFIKDSLKSRPALADYLLIFKKGYNSEVPCTGKIQTNSHGGKERIELTNDNWIEWAHPVWLSQEDGVYLPYQTIWNDIRETNTLNYRMARQDDDERHLCPLQLDLIERCVRLWSNKNETVFSPFAGVGSEGYVSLKFGRNFIGTELKPEYAECASTNCQNALDELEAAQCQTSLSL